MRLAGGRSPSLEYGNKSAVIALAAAKCSQVSVGRSVERKCARARPARYLEAVYTELSGRASFWALDKLLAGGDGNASRRFCARKAASASELKHARARCGCVIIGEAEIYLRRWIGTYTK